MSKAKVLLFILLIVALGIRLYRLYFNSPSLYIDETGGHYQAAMAVYLNQSILWGLSTFTWFLGPNPLGVRLWSTIYSSFLVLGIYFFTSGLTSKKAISLTASLLTVFLPWNFMLGRIGHPHVLIMLLLVTFHLGLFLRAHTTKKLIISLIPLLFSAYFYPSMILIAPLIIVSILLKPQRWLILLTAGSVLLIFSFFIYRFNGLSPQSRGFDLAIWRDVNVTAENNLYRGLSPQNFLTKIVYNYPLSVISSFTKNYFSFFSPDFLFLKGDPVLRHSTGMVGEFFPFLAPFMVYGAYRFFRDGDTKIKHLFLVWILVSPIPAAITNDGGGYLLRSITLMPFLTYFCALGLVEVYRLSKSKFTQIVFVLSISLIGIFSVFSFLYSYFNVYPALSAKSFEYGFKELSDFQQENHNANMLIIWNGYYPNMHFRFWQKTPFVDFQSFVPQAININNSVFYQRFSNLYFVWPKTEADIVSFIKAQKPIFIVFPANFIKSYPEYAMQNLVQVIKYPDGTDDFLIYTL